jgi:hypothetical protein
VLTDDDRRYLYDLLERSLDARSAAILMAHLPPVGWADLATRQDLAVTRAELKGEMAELRGEMAELRGEMAELRGEVHSMLPKLIAANVASMIGVAGLVLATVSLAS